MCQCVLTAGLSGVRRSSWTKYVPVLAPASDEAGNVDALATALTF